MISGFYIRFSKKSAIFVADPVSFYGHAIALVIQRTFQNTAVIQNSLFRGIIVVIADAKKLFKALFCGNFYSESEHFRRVSAVSFLRTDSRSRPFDTHFYFFGLHKKCDFLADSNSDDISNPAYSIEDMQYPSYDCGHCYGKRDYVQDKRN